MAMIQHNASPVRGLHSQALDLLRFPLAVIIVIAHAFPELNTGTLFFGRPYSFDNYPACSIAFNFFSAFFRRQSVPIYFFISGYVFFLGIEHFGREEYTRKLKNRVKTLLIPYLIWNTFSVAAFLLANLPAILQTQSFPPLHWLLSAYWIYDGNFLINATGTGIDPIDGPLWFLRNLMVVVLTTPVIHYLIKRFKYWPLILLGNTWFFVRISSPGPNLSYSFLTAYLFFFWGAYMSISQKDMIAAFGRFSKPLLFSYLILGCSYLVFAHVQSDIAHIIKQLTLLIGLPVAYNTSIWSLRHEYCKVNSNLAGAGFFIYASHIPILRHVLAFFTRGASSDLGILLAYILTILSTLGILLAVYWVLQRFFPSLLKVMTGKK